MLHIKQKIDAHIAKTKLTEDTQFWVPIAAIFFTPTPVLSDLLQPKTV